MVGPMDALLGLEADDFHYQEQSGHAEIDGDRVVLLQVSGELLFELLGAFTDGEPIAAEGANNLVDFGVIDGNFKKRNFHDCDEGIVEDKILGRY